MTGHTNFSYAVKPEPPGPLLRQQLIDMVIGRRKASENSTQTYRRNLVRWYDLWRNYYSGNFSPTKNNVTVPLIFSTIESDVARKVATAFSQWPIVGMKGYGPDDSMLARKQEHLVNAQLNDAGIIRKEYNTFLAADICGTSVSQVMWEHQEEPATYTDFLTTPLSGETVRIRQKGIATTFDGPNYRLIDALDFYEQPGFLHINGNQGMQYCLVRYYLDLDQCRYLASEAGGNIYDAAEVNRLAAEDASRAFREDEFRQRRFKARMGMDEEIVAKDRYTRPVEIIEMWGMIPSEFRPYFGGANKVVISVGNEKYLFRARETPIDHRQKPFISYSPTPDMCYFRAPGKAEIAAQLQVAANRFINQQLDAADIVIHPMLIYNRRKIINPRKMIAGAGRLFAVDGPIADSLAPMPMDFRGVQLGGAMTDEMWRYIQMGSGVQEDTIMGGMGSDRQTAREYLGRREASGTRLMLESVLYDTDYLEPLANMFTALNLQFFEPGREVLILGDSALVDPNTGQPINEERVRIDPEVLTRQYAARAIGTTMNMSREAHKANLLTALQIVGSMPPETLGNVNMVAFFREIFSVMGLRNVNEIIQQSPTINERLGGQPAAGVPTGQDLLGLAGGGAPSGPGSMNMGI